MSSHQASITLVVGASGSGKSLWVKSLVDSLPRSLLIFDPMHEYAPGGARVCHSLKAFIADLKMGASLVVYRPTQLAIDKQFDLFCRVALASPGCSVIAEELSFVTKAGYSPAGWREVITTGRHKGLTVIGITQRPALVDKTILSNATVIRVGRLNSAGDKKTMADALDIDVDQLRALRPLDWIAKNMATGEVTRERLAVPGARPARTRKSKNA